MTFAFVPGFMADDRLWGGTLEALRWSEGTAFADLTQGASIEDMAQRTLDALPGELDLVGFSMGGYVARAMARMAPLRVKSLVLIATSARADTPEQAQRKRVAAAQLSSTARFQGLSRASILASLHADRAGDDAMVDQVRAMGLRLGQAAFMRQAALPRLSDLETLAQIHCPTLVIAAREDRLRSLEEARELAQGIAGTQLIVLEGSGHMLPLEVPHALARAMHTWWRQAGRIA